MAGNMVYDLVEPAVLIDYVRAYDNEVLRQEAAFVLDRWIPNREVDDLEFRVRKSSLQDVDAAVYRAWDTPAPMTGRPGVQRIAGEIAPVSRQIALGEEESLRLRALERGNNDPIIDAIYADAERMTRSVQARIELARGDVINDGIVSISENGLTLTADFGRDASMSVTPAGDLWTVTATSTPLSDLLGWMETYEDLNGVTPGTLLVPRARLANFALNAEMRSYAAANGTTPTRLNRQAINDVFASEGLPPLEVYDGQFRVEGVKTRVLPQNKCFFLPPVGVPYGNTFYGITPEAVKLAAKGLIEQTALPGIVAVVTETDHPVQTYTVGTGIALPVAPNVNLVMDMTVAA